MSVSRDNFELHADQVRKLLRLLTVMRRQGILLQMVPIHVYK